MMEALWVYQWHNQVNQELLTRMLKSSDPWARAAAAVLCYWRDRVPNPLAVLKTLATDPHPGVRLEAVRAASFFQTQEAAEVALASLAQPQDRFLKYAGPDDEHAQAVRPVRSSMLGRRASTGLLVRSGGFALPSARGVRILRLAGPQALAQDAPKILLDQPLRAVECQLGRLSNEELVLVERKEGDVRYRPVYFALLTRRGVAPQFRDEALTALVGLDKTSKSRVLLEALSKVPIDDALTGEKLLGLLLAQPADTLRKAHVRRGDRHRRRARRSSFVVRTAPS